MTIEVHLKVETLADLAAELHRVLGPLLAQQGVTLPEAPKRVRPRKDSVPVAEQAAEPPEAPAAEEAPAPEPQPEPEAETPPPPPTLEEVRALLSRYQASHPGQLAATLDLLERLGGSRRVLNCPVETWPVIAAAVEQYLAQSDAA